jgi:site-specific recombinase XerD
VPLNRINNAVVRERVSTLLSSGLSAATTRKAVFALRRCLAAAIADERIQLNPPEAVPRPTERQKPPRYLSQSEVERLVEQMPRQYRALVLVARTPDFAGEKLRSYGDGTLTRYTPASVSPSRLSSRGDG